MTNQERRRFIKLGAAVIGSSVFGSQLRSKSNVTLNPAVLENDFRMPGNNQIPGSGTDKQWPRLDKYLGTTRVPGMCQLCSTICGIVGHVKDGRLLKIEGNPNDPNSRGRVCARGQAGLNHLYHPERLLYPMKRVGERGEGYHNIQAGWDQRTIPVRVMSYGPLRITYLTAMVRIPASSSFLGASDASCRQHAVSIWSACGQRVVSVWSAYRQGAWSACSEHIVRAWSAGWARGEHVVCGGGTWSAYGKHAHGRQQGTVSAPQPHHPLRRRGSRGHAQGWDRVCHAAHCTTHVDVGCGDEALLAGVHALPVLVRDLGHDKHLRPLRELKLAWG